MSTQKYCGCGCGATTGSKFAVGHDSRFVSQQIALILETKAEGAIIDSVAEHIAGVGSLALAEKFRRNLTKAKDRQDNPKPKRPSRKIGRTSNGTEDSVTGVNSRARADALINRINNSYWTGQVGTYREGGGLELPAKVLCKDDDGMLVVRLDFGDGQLQDRRINKEHFIRSNFTRSDDIK